jgi:hypothetical protein
MSCLQSDDNPKKISSKSMAYANISAENLLAKRWSSGGVGQHRMPAHQ